MISIYEKKSINKNQSCNQKVVCSLFVTTLLLFGCSSTSTLIQKPPHHNEMSVYIDPATGEFLSEPKYGQEVLIISPEMKNATSTSSDDLIQEKSPISGGGIMMDLKGRFQSPLIVTQDPDGKIKAQHLNDIPALLIQQPAEAVNEGAGNEKK